MWVGAISCLGPKAPAEQTVALLEEDVCQLLTEMSSWLAKTKQAQHKCNKMLMHVCVKQ